MPLLKAELSNNVFRKKIKTQLHPLKQTFPNMAPN